MTKILRNGRQFYKKNNRNKIMEVDRVVKGNENQSIEEEPVISAENKKFFA